MDFNFNPFQGSAFTGAGLPWGAPEEGKWGFHDPSTDAYRQFQANPSTPSTSPSAPTQTNPNKIADYSASNALETQLRKSLAGTQPNTNFNLNLQQKPSNPMGGRVVR